MGGPQQFALAGATAMLGLSFALPATADELADERSAMVERQIAARGIDDDRVLDAMRTVRRHQFVPANVAGRAYDDTPLPIGHGQTISQPYIVALMTSVLALKPGDRVLEVGTGSAYQAAVLGELGAEVFSIEILQPLADAAAGLIADLGYRNIRVRQGDGYFGWEEAAPFDHVMITAAVDHVPPPLLRQLTVGGRLILPLGNPFSYQSLVMITKTALGFQRQGIIAVRFVPMTGAAMR